METVIKKHLDVEKIERIARENKYDKKTYAFFLEEIEKNLIKELFAGFTDQSEDCIINKVVELLREVSVFQKKGYSIEWAAEYIHRIQGPEKAHAVAFACQTARNASVTFELKDLNLYAQLTGRDENFAEHFKFLLYEPNYEVVFDVPYEETADNYSKMMKKLQAEGKSRLYAKYYAYYAACNEFSPDRCHIAGMEADLADKNEIDEYLLFEYVDVMSRYIYDNFDVYEDSLSDKKTNRKRKEYY